MVTEFGELRGVPVRQIWPNEAHDFTDWLAKNISRLGDAIGMELELVRAESEVGDFSLDILAKDLGTGRHVVIENQYSSTNHDHLGKLLTYASGHDAAAAIWIAEKVRDEHRAALEWLNLHTDVNTHFFAVTVEVFRIDESRPAFEFKPVVLPNEWQRQARSSTEREISQRGESYRKFFQELLDELREKHRFTGARVGQPQNWYAFSAGVPGVSYGSSFALGNRVRAEVYLDEGDAERNKAFFDRLHARKQDLEKEFGEPLEWERLDDRRASRIAAYRPGSIDQDEQALREIRIWIVDRLLRFKRVFGPELGREVTNKP